MQRKWKRRWRRLAKAILPPVAAGLILIGSCGSASADGSVLPAGGQIVAGSGNISQNGSAMTINQTTNSMVANWQNFSIGVGGTVNFVQPSASAVVLNRVVGNNASNIYGTLTANGRVFLVNPNGVLFAPGSQVNVGGLVASTLSISDSDFLSGKYSFVKNGTAGSVINQGTITAADHAVFIGTEVNNEGVIAARITGLAAGNKVSLDFTGDKLYSVAVDTAAAGTSVSNSGKITADGGLVLMTTGTKEELLKTVVNNTGIIQAQSVENDKGVIKLIGSTVNVSGTINASAPNGGDGGFVETSGAQVNIDPGAKVTTLASGGQTGTWLIDPYNFTIGTGTSGTNYWNCNDLIAALAANNVTIQTDNSGGTEAGDINVEAIVAWFSNKLTLNAYHSINLNSALIAGQLEMNTGAGGTISYGLTPSGFRGAIYFGSSGNGLLTINGQDYTVIRTLAELQNMQANLSGRYFLGATIAGGGASFMPVGWVDGSPFTGVFDGGGHTISGLNMQYTGPHEIYSGIFAQANGAIFRNVGLNNTFSAKGSCVGALVSYATGGSITSCYNTSSMTIDPRGLHYLGGIAGDINDGCVIAKCFNTGTLSGYGETGGVVGRMYGATMDQCFNIGDIYANDGSGGGVVGDITNSSITNSYNTGNIFKPNTFDGGSVGGIVSFSSGAGLVNGCYNTGNLTNLRPLGSLGGIVGGIYDVGPRITVTNCYNTGTLTGPDGSPQAGSTTLAQLKAGLPGGFDASIWRSYDGYSLPLLRTFLTPLTVSVADSSKTYNGANTSVGSVTYSTTIYPFNDLQGSLTYTGGGRSAGIHTLTGGYSLTQSGFDITYVGTLTVEKAPLSVTVSPQNKVYDGTANASLAYSDNRIAGDSLTFGSTSSFADKNVGSGKTVNVGGITVGGADAGNYTVNVSITGSTADITARALTVTANGVNKTYDGTIGATVTYGDNRVSGDVLAVSGTATFEDKNAGSGKTVNVGGISLSGADAGNYTANTTAATTADITARVLTVTATGENKVYDGMTTASVTYDDNRVSGDVFTVNGTATFEDKNAGSGKTVNVGGISLSGADDGNYTCNTTAATTADITARALTVTATGMNKVYDGMTTATVTYGDNRVNGDLLTVSGTAVFDNKKVGTGKNVSVSGISLSGIDADNYTCNTTATTAADITRRSLTVAATGVNKVYDGTTAATVTYGDNRVNGDLLTVSGTATFGDKNADSGKTVNVGGISLSGADAENYNLSGTAAATMADITKAALTVKGNDDMVMLLGVAYSGGNGVTYNGLVSGETPAVLGGALIYGGTAQGARSRGLYTITPGGLTSDNYTITFVSGRLVVLPPDAYTAAVMTSQHLALGKSNSRNRAEENGGTTGSFEGLGGWFAGGDFFGGALGGLLTISDGGLNLGGFGGQGQSGQDQ